MTLKLFELVGTDDARSFSPFCCSAHSSGRASSARSNCSLKTIRSMRGAKGCSTRSTAWRAIRRDIRCSRVRLKTPRCFVSRTLRPRVFLRHARACPGHLRPAYVVESKTWMAGTSPAMTLKKTPRRLFDSVYARRRLPQTVPAQTILAVIRHRQAGRVLGAPAWPRQAAGEFRAASGTDEAARGRNI